jgi:hypothetical protein
MFLEINYDGYPYSAIPGLAILPGFLIILSVVMPVNH